MSILETKQLHKTFNGVPVVNGVSLSIESGKITSLIGPNGSGKSTTINLITGMIPFDGGAVVIEKGTILSRIQPNQIASYGITRTFQNVEVFEQMTALDNILLVLTERNVFSSLFEKHTQYHLDIAERVMKRLDIWEKRNDMVENLSYGQRKLLEIARVIAMGERTDGETKVLFFDEPYAGLFPEMVKLVTTILKELRDEGKAIILVEHNMDLIRELSDYVYVLDAGKHLKEGSVDNVLSDQQVIEAYLGN
ncbi:ATP-binding cassette domain-containing protein [Patescibacteria group bacterium]|nr:ATP-binding cassette domain-containing protein [Patescibacteria group bacterium]